MKITRTGAYRNHGSTQIMGVKFVSNTENSWLNNNVRWDPCQKQISISNWNILYKDGRTHHDYTITLSLEDVAALIMVLGHAGSADDAQLLRDHLKDQIPALVKLLACATGLAPNPMPDNQNK